MSFYEKIIPYYDDIFPFNQKAYQLISKHFPAKCNVLDIGAGTGTMAIRLAKDQFQVTALEPEEEMVRLMQEKADKLHIDFQIARKNMQQLSTLSHNFNAVYCIGNTLAHVKNLDDMQLILKEVYELLSPDGHFLIQIVNFDKALADGNYKFPVIQKESFTFERTYALQKQQIAFTTTLTTNHAVHKQSTLLYPITSTTLTRTLQQSGFRTVQLFGNYLEQPFSIQSPAIIALARK